ncbi:type IV pilin [Halobaculum lipolyticum]|uniref:Type IV pilin n=1 Tax=Halobaculum lipolyticum TaxID=3032001 RepID=A0ABD5W8X6_9EURY|nr:type IV pilin [Halobaculum sp. DT31]
MSDRGISPVVGVALMVVVVVLLGVVVGALAFGFDDRLGEPAPQVALEVTTYSADGAGNSDRPYLEIHHRAGEVADGTAVFIRDESGNEIAWSTVWTAGPTVGPGSYAHIDGCNSDGALDVISAAGQTYSIVFRDDGRTLVVYDVEVPTPPSNVGC